ncbi:dynactin subunit 4 [Bacillus rossius redtenbacheri]|uniref:dynactin subunit 4 n=1 Tax=Bacillus rossius redtenbacheri TaxID=93214 RepID=UPI002FDDF95B
MAFFLQKETVKLACNCGSLKPIYRLYFCRHCQKIRCAYCVSHEVESHYCSHCLENLASADARLKRNCCTNCNDCPACSHVLSVRIVPVTSADPDDPSRTVTRKGYYLVCSFCRWTSRDAGMPDQTSATGGWAEREVPHARRISSLLEHYKGLAAKERQEKEKRKYVPRRSYLHFSDKFGLSTLLARKRAGLAPQGPGLKDDASGLPELEPAEASEGVEPLPESVFSEPLDLSQVTTMAQRLLQVEVQPADVRRLLPVHKPLLVKRSLRCRECEHNVSKPETSPSSTKFKIQLFAYYHVPEVRVVTCEPLLAGRPAQLVLKLCNPTQHQTTLSFLPLPSPEEDRRELELALQERRKKRAPEAKGSAGGREDATAVVQSFTRQLSAGEDPRPVAVEVTGDVVLPECSVVLPPRDDAAEYDDVGDSHVFHDDPKVVAWRKANKAAVKLSVLPRPEAPGGEVVVGFLLQYSYVNTIPALDQRTPQTQDLRVRVYLSLGPTLGG